ncbi:hypothetical protein V8C86DRAFT_3089765 [Haematococcus lacustris]
MHAAVSAEKSALFTKRATADALKILASQLAAKQQKEAELVTLRRPQYQHEAHFQPEEGCGVFPPRAPELHSICDYVDTEGDLLPSETHPYGWVPVADQALGVLVRPRTGQIQTKTSTTMPLEYFDSPDMELVPPEERLAGLALQPPQPVQGFSRFYSASGAFTWAPCRVLAYDRGRDLYCIEWEASQRRKWVKRLNLFFANESRIGFRFRLRQARRRKDEVERQARYHEYVTLQPFRSLVTLDERWRRRLARRTGKVWPHPVDAFTEGVLAEVLDVYKYAVKAAIVNHQFMDPDQTAHLLAANVQPVKISQPVPPQGCVNLTLLPQGREVASQGQQLAVAQDLGLEPFSLLLSDVQTASFLARPPLLAAMHAYYEELDMREVVVPDIKMSALELPARLSEFVRLQRLHVEEVQDHLENEWTMRVVGIVEQLMPIKSTAAVAAAAAAAGVGAGAHPPGAGAGSASPRPSMATGGMRGSVAGHAHGQGDRVRDSDPGQGVGSIVAVGAAGAEQQLVRQQVMRFVKMLAVTMADQLRTAVLGSIMKYQKFWEEYDWAPTAYAAIAGYPDTELPGPSAATLPALPPAPPPQAQPDGSPAHPDPSLLPSPPGEGAANQAEPPAAPCPAPPTQGGPHPNLLPHPPPAAAAQPPSPEPTSQDRAHAGWRAHHPVLQWGGDMFTAVPPPLFMVQLAPGGA